MTNSSNKTKISFTKYEVFIIAILSFLQFTVVLDFMVLSPLGAILLDDLDIETSQFGLVVSAYAFSAGASGLLAAGFADKFDRKKLLLFFYTGFVIGTISCALAPDYYFLLIARIVTGIFGGVISAIGFAIITDLFKMEVRGRVMGFSQMAFAASQVLGIPIGLLLANSYGWHSPFWMISALTIVAGVVIFIYMKPITEHLKIKSERNPFEHLWKTLSKSEYLRGFLATSLLATGGFMMMPFGSAYSTNNLNIALDDLPIMYGITGICTMIVGPLIGRLSDKAGKYNVFVMGSFLSIVMVAIYTNIGVSPLWLVIILNILLFVGISSRMIPSSALMTAVPKPQDRGAFMSINSSIQQISGGIASAIAGMIISQAPNGKLEHYDTLGYVVIGSMSVAIYLFYILNKQIEKNSAHS
jgi:predicted MFS family arabinose efflux permease